MSFPLSAVAEEHGRLQPQQHAWQLADLAQRCALEYSCTDSEPSQTRQHQHWRPAAVNRRARQGARSAELFRQFMHHVASQWAGSAPLQVCADAHKVLQELHDPLLAGLCEVWRLCDCAGVRLHPVLPNESMMRSGSLKRMLRSSTDISCALNLPGTYAWAPAILPRGALLVKDAGVDL